MFEKIGRLAEKAATNIGVSRRGFLGRLGQGALAAAGLLGGLLLLPGDARAGGSVVCCVYQCSKKGGYTQTLKTLCQSAGTTCAPTSGSNCTLIGSTTAADCKSCK
jgi:hypothetical protein